MAAVHVYPGKLALFHIRDEADAKVRREAFAEIRAMYEGGAPIFSKGAIRKVQEQIDQAKKGENVFVPALDGSEVGFEIETGEVGPGIGSVIMKPFIWFRAIQHLLSSKEITYAREAYCSMCVWHYLDDGGQYGNIGDISAWKSHTLAETKMIFETACQAWASSSQHAALRSLLLGVDISGCIRRVIGFALGSISDAGKPEWAHTMAYQHACLLSICDILREKNCTTEDFTCISQDPAQTGVDRETLQQSQIESVESPHGFLEVDDDTVVLNVSPNVPVKQIVLDIARPAILIWDIVRQSALCPAPEDFPNPTRSSWAPMLYTDPDSPRTMDVLEKYYNRFEFPGGSEHFPAMNIFVRRASRR